MSVADDFGGEQIGEPSDEQRFEVEKIDGLDVSVTVVPPDWSLCVGATCEALGTEAIDYTTDDGERYDMKVCMDCLRQANTDEGLDFLLMVRGHIGGR